MKELTTRQQQAISTRRKISQAAYTLLKEESYEQLKMSTIALHAGVSVGTLYHYFTSKEELLFSGYNDFDEMVHELCDSFHFNSHLEAIRSIIYAQTCGCLFRGVNIMTNILRIQLSTHSSLFFNQGRYFPQYIANHVQQALSNGELHHAYSTEEITETILRTSRGIIFDCTGKNNLEKIGEIAIHDLDIILSHYSPDHKTDFPSVNPAWLDAYAKWFELNDQNQT